MEKYTIALFGEAEKGEYHLPYHCRSLTELDAIFGNPPIDSCGLYYAIQALLYQRHLIFFRVREEGFSIDDYLAGLQILENQNLFEDVAAICTPGVGDEEIFRAIHPVCEKYHSFLIVNESDLYDYLLTGK